VSQTTAIHGEKISLLRVLGPGHVWALGVGIVLVGEYMGWNFSVGKGGAIAALIACWVAGLLYTCVAMIDSEVTSTVAAAGGQYAQAKHIVGPLMAYLPIAISRRLIAGWQIPLCIFGAYTLLRLIDSKVPLRRTIAVGALALSAISTLVVIGMGVAFVGTPRPPLYQTADELAALKWLGAHTTDRDVVLADWRFGNLQPMYADARVFVGHPIETIGFQAKRAAVERYFDPSTPEIDRQKLIDRWQITLVVAPTDRPVAPDREIVFQQGDLVIYRATP